MEMSSRRKLVGPDLSKLLVWWALRSRNGEAYYDHRSRVVVCGPAAAVEGAEEGVHFGSEGGRLMGHLPFDSGGIEVSWEEELDEAGMLLFFLFRSPARRADV